MPRNYYTIARVNNSKFQTVKELQKGKSFFFNVFKVKPWHISTWNGRGRSTKLCSTSVDKVVRLIIDILLLISSRNRRSKKEKRKAEGEWEEVAANRVDPRSLPLVVWIAARPFAPPFRRCSDKWEIPGTDLPRSYRSAERVQRPQTRVAVTSLRETRSRPKRNCQQFFQPVLQAKRTKLPWNTRSCRFAASCALRIAFARVHVFSPRERIPLRTLAATYLWTSAVTFELLGSPRGSRMRIWRRHEKTSWRTSWNLKVRGGSSLGEAL